MDLSIRWQDAIWAFTPFQTEKVMETTDMEDDIISRRIKDRLELLGITANHAALKAGLGKTAVRDIIARKSKSPSADTLSKLAAILQCSVGYLVGEVDAPGRIDSMSMLGARVDYIEGELQAAVFRDVRTLPEPNSKNLIYQHPLFYGQRFTLYRMGDDSMAGIGLFKDDVLTVAGPMHLEHVPLDPGMLVVAKRMLAGRESLAEISVREVAVRNGSIVLQVRGLDQAGAPPFTLDRRDDSGLSTSLYVSGEGDGVIILGLVVRWVHEPVPADFSMFPD
jgi:transcriptional regulator with XRE-family HTH domain